MDDDFEAEFVRSEVELKAPSPLSFMPWHKPRKQYVRLNQWLHHAKDRIQKLKDSGYFVGGVPLKYFTLPGPDLLDVKLMIELCREMGVQLHYTGFCFDKFEQEDRLRQNISQFRNNYRDVVTPGSNVYNVSFQDLVNAQSSAKLELTKGGPYQIVNVDACTPIMGGEVGSTSKLIDGLKELFQYQINYCAEDWILLITSPVQQENITNEFLEKVLSEITKNCEQFPEFKLAVEGKVTSKKSLEEYYEEVRKTHSTDFLQLATLGISKWLVHLGESGNSRVKKLNGFCYSTFQKAPLVPNMVSVCFLIEKLGVNLKDGSGLTKDKETTQSLPNLSDHMRALMKSYSMVNVDDYLKEHDEEYEVLIDESITLLSSAGYKVGENGVDYRQWLETDLTHKHVTNTLQEDDFLVAN